MWMDAWFARRTSMAGALAVCVLSVGCNDSSDASDGAADGGLDAMVSDGGVDSGEEDATVDAGPDATADAGQPDADASDAATDGGDSAVDAGPPGFDMPGIDARLSNPCVPPADGQMWTMLSDTPCFERNGDGKLVAIAPLIPFDINSELWSDFATKERLLSLPDGATLDVLSDGDIDFPEGTMFIKTFFLNGRRLETRFLVHHPTRTDGDGGVTAAATWEGYAYRWADNDSDARLITDANWESPTEGTVIADVPGPQGLQKWTIPWTPKTFPEPLEADMCMRCHTAVARRALGPELQQLNKLYAYPSTGRTANQLYTWQELGLFTEPLPARDEWPYLQPYEDLDNPERVVHPDVLSGEVSWEVAARSFLHSNCSYCHRPTGPGPSEVLLVTTPFAEMGLCDRDAMRNSMNPELPDRLFVPGDADNSAIFWRVTDETVYGEMTTFGDGGTPRYRMPYIASDLVDAVGSTILRNWINQTDSCP